MPPSYNTYTYTHTHAQLCQITLIVSLFFFFLQAPEQRRPLQPPPLIKANLDSAQSSVRSRMEPLKSPFSTLFWPSLEAQGRQKLMPCTKINFCQALVFPHYLITSVTAWNARVSSAFCHLFFLKSELQKTPQLVLFNFAQNFSLGFVLMLKLRLCGTHHMDR